jgi:putative mRNA 3-end processing factor
MSDMVVVRKEGLYCVPGDFYIDPWKPVDRAVITHAHGDHARWGHKHYLASEKSVNILKSRLGADINIDGLEYGERIVHNGVAISLHPAGHVLGSAQVRMEHEGEIWVASGDYKVEPDATCAPFEPVRCHSFITESTFGLPIYRWDPQQEVFDDINALVAPQCRRGPHQRAVRLFLRQGPAPAVRPGSLDRPDRLPWRGRAAEPRLPRRRRALPETRLVSETDKADLKTALVLAPPSAAGSTWTRRFGDYSDAFASGWMLLRGARRRRGVDRGFVLSDHADWPGLLEAIHATGAQQVVVTHGSIPVMVRWLCQIGLDAKAFDTEYGDEDDEAVAATPQEPKPEEAGEASDA